MSAVELNPQTLPGYVEQVAPKYGLDPAAVLAVAHQEGLGGGIGDSGTSFGPFQLHAGGALPQEEYQGAYSPETQHWSWSPEGVDYALAQMQAHASGLSGAAAIEAIVTQFERPANPTKEIQGAEQAYPQFAGGASDLGFTSTGLDLGPKMRGQTPTGVATVEGLGGKLLSPVEDVVFRGLLILGGLAFALIGIVLLVRAFTGQTIVKQAAGVVAAVETGGLSAGVRRGASSSAPRRKGDAAVRRGGAVTRTGPPGPVTRSDRRQMKRIARERETLQSQGDTILAEDDIPF